MTTVVADSTPLNYLAILSDFDLLRQLYGSLTIPLAVFEEVVARHGQRSYRRKQQHHELVNATMIRYQLNLTPKAKMILE